MFSLTESEYIIFIQVVNFTAVVMKRSFQHTTKEDNHLNYNEMKVKDLKQLVSLRGLSTRGLTRKEQFIRILEQDDKKHSARESSTLIKLEKI